MVEDVCGGGGGVVCSQWRYNWLVWIWEDGLISNVRLKLFRRMAYAWQSCQRGVAAI
jgi:hypothetical protein